MSIIEKKKTNLSIGEPIFILNIPKIKEKLDQHDYFKNELDKLKDVNEKNIKLALQIKELRKKYDEIKNQHNQDIKLLIEYKKIIDKINFNFICPELNKNITLYNCIDACSNRICKQSYKCLIRKEKIIDYFRLKE